MWSLASHRLLHAALAVIALAAIAACFPPSTTSIGSKIAFRMIEGFWTSNKGTPAARAGCNAPGEASLDRGQPAGTTGKKLRGLGSGARSPPPPPADQADLQPAAGRRQKTAHGAGRPGEAQGTQGSSTADPGIDEACPKTFIFAKIKDPTKDPAHTQGTGSCSKHDEGSQQQPTRAERPPRVASGAPPLAPAPTDLAERQLRTTDSVHVEAGSQPNNSPAP